jgi:hypothetical protein
MRARYLVLLSFVACSAFAASQSRAFTWTERTISGLTIDLVDPVKWETLYFRPHGTVAVTWGTKHSFTAPLLDWKLAGRTVRIYDDDKVVEELTPVRRDGPYLLLRKRDGTIGRFRVVEGKV